jgi:hypothetical protein
VTAVCCDAFGAAMEVCTDNEGYGRLISEYCGGFWIGTPVPSGKKEQAEAAPKPKIPAMASRHPPGCPDPDFCRGNGICHWDCKESR